MPVPLLIAMVLAFGIRLPTEARALRRDELTRTLSWTGLGVLVVALSGVFLGRWISARVRRLGLADAIARRRSVWAKKVVVCLGLGTYAVTLILLDWVRVVDWSFGLRGVPVIEEIAVLLPYLLGQALAFAGLYQAERAIRLDSAARSVPHDLFLRGRRTAALILPVALMVVLGRDFLQEGTNDDPTLAFAVLCGLATIVFILSPAFVRLAFPLSPLPKGELRDRLERLSRRLGFRCTDILIWDTGQSVINAGVTGAIPQFRYVLLTDALIGCMDGPEIEAVFGHEVGHVAHRHLPYFAIFFLGSAALLMLAASAVERFADVDRILERWVPDGSVGEVVKTSIFLFLLGAFFFLAFGALSRRLERQADLYGTRAVSCGLSSCPPHVDPNLPAPPELPVREVCPEGVRIFAHALTDVALLNGMSIDKGSWRHGTIATRIAFLQGLASQPGSEQRFERSTSRLMWGLLLGLSAACAVAGSVSLFGSTAP